MCIRDSYEVDGSRSSQFASGLLIALAHAVTPDGTPAPAALTVTGPIVSRPYLDMTLRLMERFGISFTEREEGCLLYTSFQSRSGGCCDRCRPCCVRF